MGSENMLTTIALAQHKKSAGLRGLIDPRLTLGCPNSNYGASDLTACFMSGRRVM